MTPYEEFKQSCAREIARQGEDRELADATLAWMTRANGYNYSYHFEWFGRPIIQYPQDIVAMQELIWQVRPDVIVETGIAHGGSLCFSASMLAMLDYCDALAAGATLDPSRPGRKVIGLDIDIREHNRQALQDHPLCNRMVLLEGSSIDPQVVGQVRELVADCRKVLLCLDSCHTHEHVLGELEAYAPLVTPDSYCVVFDTIVEDFPAGTFPDRPWEKGANPKTAVWEFLRSHPEFEIDRDLQNKLLVTVAPDGYLRRKA